MTTILARDLPDEQKKQIHKHFSKKQQTRDKSQERKKQQSVLQAELNLLSRQLVELTARNDNTKVVKARINHIRDVKNNRSSYVKFWSEFGTGEKQIRTLLANLSDSLSDYNSGAAETYSDNIRTLVNYMDESIDRSKKDLGMSPSMFVYVKKDEFGEAAEPQYDLISDDVLSPYEKQGQSSYTNGVKAASMYKRHSDVLFSLCDYYHKYKHDVNKARDEFEETAWELLWKNMPTIDNDKDQLMRRLGFVGLRNFAQDLLELRDRVETRFPGQRVTKNELLKRTKDLYEKHGIRLSEPSALERRKMEQSNFDLTEIQLSRLLNIGWRSFM